MGQHDELPFLKYPWLVVENLELQGRHIQGCFHGSWLILSNHLMWSLWNPVTCTLLNLPPLFLEDESIDDCCLSSPPDDLGSVLLLTSYEKRTLIFCRLDCKRSEYRWIETSYAKQLESITGKTDDDGFLHCLTCCNGKVYTLTTGWYEGHVIHVDILVRDKQVVINLSLFGKLAYPLFHWYTKLTPVLKGSGTELFYILFGFDEVAKKTLGDVYLYKLDMTTSSMIWEDQVEYQLGNAIFLMDRAHNRRVFYREIGSEFGGYIHILDDMGKLMQSYNVKDKTVSLSSMPCLVSSSCCSMSLWECRLQGDHGEVKCRAKLEGDNMMQAVSAKNEENTESHLLSIPFDVLEMIMEHCVGVEYLNFRATCKSCQLGAPIARWSKGTALSRLHTPWLMVLDQHQDIMTFTDPVFGDKYFIKTPQELKGGYIRINCSKHGWLLITQIRRPFHIMNDVQAPRLVFFNPFTREIRELPQVPCVETFCFSEPPTSPDCMVVGLGKLGPEWNVYIHFVAREPDWHITSLHIFDAKPDTLRFPTFCGPELYALCDNGELVTFEIENLRQDYSWEKATVKAPTSSTCGSSSIVYYLVKHDEYFLLVKMGEFGESILVYRLNDSTKEWEKIDGLGRHMIYICDATCLYMDAKTREMENKIYFPRLHSENEKIVCYSLETSTYHTSDGQNMGTENFSGSKHHTYGHAWIEPSWS